MKKFISMLLIVCLLLSLAACSFPFAGKGKNAKDAKQEDKTEQTDKDNDKDNDTEDADEADKTENGGYNVSDGLLTEARYYNPNGLNFNTYLYEYDSQFRMAKETVLGVNDAPESCTEYKYGADGLMSEKLYYTATDAENYELMITTKYSYTNGLVSSEESYSGGALYSKTVYEYAAGSDSPSKETSYDGFGNMISSVEYTYEGSTVTAKHYDSVEGTTVEKDTMNADGNPAEVVLSDESGLVLSRVVFEYDKNGNETKQTVYGINNELISETNSSYTLDKKGNITRSENDAGSYTLYKWQYVNG